MYKGAAFQDNSAVPLCDCLLGTSCQTTQDLPAANLQKLAKLQGVS